MTALDELYLAREELILLIATLDAPAAKGATSVLTHVERALDQLRITGSEE